MDPCIGCEHSLHFAPAPGTRHPDVWTTDLKAFLALFAPVPGLAAGRPLSVLERPWWCMIQSPYAQ